MKIFIANWKMNPVNEKEAVILARKIDAKNVIIAPPSIFLNPVKKTIHFAKIAAQDIFWKNPKGAYTGELSALMVKNSGASSVIIGHSERRMYGKDTDEIVNKKIKTALDSKLAIILCVGEDKKIRKTGRKKTQEFITRQLIKALQGINKNQMKKIAIAYEPIWAIGTGNNATPQDATFVSNFIREFLKKRGVVQTKILYGGSVNISNIKAFLNQKEIDGFLVGGASLKPSEFIHMVTMGN